MSEEVMNEEVKEEMAAKVTADADESNKQVQLGTKDTKEVLKFIFACVKTAKEAKENDGNINGADIMLLSKIFPHVGPAFEDADNIIKELKDLDEAELKDLIVFTGVNMSGVVEGKALEILEASVDAAVALVKVIALIAKKK